MNPPPIYNIKDLQRLSIGTTVQITDVPEHGVFPDVIDVGHIVGMTTNRHNELVFKVACVTKPNNFTDNIDTYIRKYLPSRLINVN